MSPLVQPVYTPDEYLRLERSAGHRSEFVNGRIYAMGGASHAHNLIVFNLAREIGAQLRGRPCEAYVNDMRVKVRQTGIYAYPDLVALCEEPRFEDGDFDTLLNPTVIIEVLSESTEKYDRGEKFAHYRRLDSLREYILVSQDRQRAEKYVRDGEGWVLTEVSGAEASLTIETLGCTIALAEIYERVEFSAPADRERP
ncbi:Uma2 family endonuclease [Longimicrobium sp.]|uniref:Uma2 family endonuclease n=1 Tax=Longimicrobium sp. TaxID=2029185 RepID=UPI002C0A69B1|nr:Uma2 family endonuclease [Longimicrobium sp.]HSU15029.1 Uma2 family endonuclease [Longimicrobium sp.]